MNDTGKVEVNVEEIMREIRRKIQMEEEAERLPTFESIPLRGEKVQPSAVQEQMDWPLFMESLGYVNLNYDIPYYWSFGANSIKTFLKRVVRKLAKCILPPILAKQNMMNANFVRCLNQLRCFVEDTRARDAKRSQDLEEIREGQRNNTEKLQELLEKQIASLEDQLNALEERSRALEEQSSVLEERSRALEEQSGVQEERSRALEEQSSALEERSRALEEQSSALEERSRVLEEQSSALEERSRALEEQSSALEEHSGALEEQYRLSMTEQEQMREKLQWLEQEGVLPEDSKELEFPMPFVSQSGEDMILTLFWGNVGSKNRYVLIWIWEQIMPNI